MGVIDKLSKDGDFAIKELILKNLIEVNFRQKNTKEYFKWNEDVGKQKYEWKQLSKIGFTNEPFIKKLHEQHLNEKPMKIGIPEKPILINKDKAVQIKIGHGNPEFLGKK